MPSPRTIKTSPDPLSFRTVLQGTWREALVLFLLSGAFAILFNAFYADGIELRVKPKVPHLPQGTSAPTDYPGLEPAARVHPTPGGTRTQRNARPVGDPFPRLSLQGAYQRFMGKNAVFLDARKPEEYQEGHIPGALNFFGNEMDRYAPLVLPRLSDKTQEIVAYCHGGECDLSLQVARALKEQGYGQVKIFQDGWPAWKKAGYPVRTGETP